MDMQETHAAALSLTLIDTDPSYLLGCCGQGSCSAVAAGIGVHAGIGQQQLHHLRVALVGSHLIDGGNTILEA